MSIGYHHLIHDTIQYNDHHALVLVQIFDFREGILYLYEKARQFTQIIEYYKEMNSYSGAFLSQVNITFICCRNP